MEDYEEDMRYLYTYGSMNQMLEKTAGRISEDEETIHMTYAYDARGNLTGEYRDGRLCHGYAYNAANKLEKAWNDTGKEVYYSYNALGQRTKKDGEDTTENYLLDLTKPYNNLLGIEKEEGMQKFFWDANAAVMEDEKKKLHYYLQDDLGSPLRVLYGNGNGDVYGYDEFGRDIYKAEEETGFKKRYSRQGESQPFGYTGYRYDTISHTYFAQAREYQPEYGRFMAEDVIRGNISMPKTLNRYGYCWNNPVMLVDLDGMYPRPAWLYGIYAHIQFETEFLELYQENVGTMARKDTYGKINVYIPGGGRTGGIGFADLVLYNGEDVEIYEIKPISYYEEEWKRSEGEKQLDRYVQAYEALGSSVKKGTAENVELLLNWEDTYWYDPDLTITYEMFEDSPGMIYYTFEYEDPERHKALGKQPIRYFEPDEDKEKWILAMAGMTVGAGAGTVFYAKQMGVNIKEILTSRVFPFFIILPDEIEKLMLPYGCIDDCEFIS